MKFYTYFFITSFFLINSSNLDAQCNISISNTNPCAEELINFSVTNPNGTYGWDFDGDGNIDAYGDNVNYTFPQSGVDIIYIINLFQDNTLCESEQIVVLASPNPILGVVPGNAIIDDNLIRVCSPTPSATLQLINLSTTISIDANYTINWGDGITENYTPTNFGATGFITHNYADYGYYNLTFSTIANNGCFNAINYTFYNGSNPSVGLANPGNTVGLCAPATIEFPITNYQNNPVGTVYNVFIGGELIESYTQQNVPASFSYTFLETSCGLSTSTGNYTNAYDVQIEAINPCGSSQATIEPIEISTPPELEFSTDTPENGCEGIPITISNISTNINEIISGNPSTCESSLTPSWTITPGTSGTDWDIISGNTFGSDELVIVFNNSGEYIITMTINSPACGPANYSQLFNIINSPVAGSELTLNTNAGGGIDDSCIPSIGSFTNLSTGDSLAYNWQISPANGWNFENGSSETDENIEISFNESGDYHVTLTTSNICESSQWDTSIIIVETPLVDIGPFDSFCENGTLNIDQSDVNYNPQNGTITAYNWSFPGANPNSSTDPYPTGIFYDSPGNYSINLSVTNQCGTTSVNSTLEVQTPGNLIVDNNHLICQGSTPFQLFADPEGGTWSGNGVDINGIFSPTPNTVGQNTLVYSIETGACTLIDSVLVTVLEQPNANAGEDQFACLEDEPFLLTGGTPIGGTWSTNNSGVIIGDNAFDPTASGAGIYTIIYSYIDANGCEDEDEKTLIVTEHPDVEAGPDLSICENPNDVILTGFNPIGGVWSGPGVSPSGIFNVQQTNGQGTYELQYEYTDPNTGCTNLDSMLITVVENDTAQAGENLVFCLSDDPYILEDGIPTGGTWSGIGIDPSGNFFDPTLAGVGTHIINYTFGSGICETTDARVIIVNPIPNLTLPEDRMICVNHEIISLATVQPTGGTWIGPGIDSLSFNPTIAGIGLHNLIYQYGHPTSGCTAQDTLQLNVVDIPTIIVSDSAYCYQAGTVPLPMTTPFGGIWSGPGLVGTNTFDPILLGGPGTYEFNYSFTDQNSCVVSELINISIFAPQIIDAGPNDSICLFDGLLYLDQQTPAGGVWSGDGIVDSILGIFDPEIAGGGTHNISYSSGIGNCLVTDQKTIFVIDLTGIGTGGTAEFCEFESSSFLQATGPVGGIWSGPGIINSITGLFDPAQAGPGEHAIIYEYTDPIIGCSATANKVITVFPQTPSTFSASEVSCANETVQFINQTTDFENVYWDLGDGNTTIAHDPIHIYDSAATYLVQLITENEFGCKDSSSQNILIVNVPEPVFSLDTYVGCGPLAIEFSNQSTGYETTFNWDFGNGNTSSALFPDSQIYLAGILDDTTYYTTLEASNLCGTVSLLDSITVRPIPKANFAFYPEEPCSPMTVTFGNASFGSVENFYWDLGNGNTSTDTLPANQIYTTDTTTSFYDVLLVASNECGADSSIQTVEVIPADVRSFFTVSDDRGCQPFTVEFSNFATIGANIDWIFGDGNSSIALNPVHTFNDPGTYTVIQYATSDCGYDTSAIVIEVLPSPLVNFNNTNYVCLGEAITFNNTSQNTSGSVWDFGDGTGSTLTSPEHIYSAPGTYEVSLTGFSQFNQCPSTITGSVIVQGLPIAQFEPADQFGCAPFNALFNNNSINSEFYTWDFGDGNTSVDETVTHLFEDIGTYSVQLIATDTYGCSHDTSIINIMVHPTPSADFDFDQEALCSLPANIIFENLSEGAAGFIWDFGDDNSSFGNNPAHTYFEEGNYDISLIANNQYNCADTLIASIQISAPPVAAFEVIDHEGCSPLTVSFLNASDYGDKFVWNFGDGQSSELENPTVTFTDVGIHNAELIVSNNDLCFDTLQLASLVEVFPSVNASFDTENEQEGIQTGAYNFINTSTGASNYYWEFSDGSISNEINPEHRFETNGAQQIYLSASNEFGCQDDTLVSLTPDWIKGLFIPNGFSPEQGIGDVRLFKPAGIGLKEYKIQVFSPYGQILWESNKLTDEGKPAEAWDGTYQGKMLPQDVYVWKAWGMFGDGTVWPGEKRDDGNYKTIGSVILLR